MLLVWGGHQLIKDSIHLFKLNVRVPLHIACSNQFGKIGSVLDYFYYCGSVISALLHASLMPFYDYTHFSKATALEVIECLLSVKISFHAFILPTPVLMHLIS